MKRTVWAFAGIMALGTGALIASSGAFSPSADAAASTARTTVTVYGTSTTMVTPQKAMVTLGVNNLGLSAAAALADNNRIVNRIVAALKSLGIKESAIQTSGLGINPQYKPNQSKISGYQVNDMITVSTTVSLAGQVIDKGVASGANQLDGVSFPSASASQYRTTYQRALKNAGSQASALAHAAGERVLGIKSVVVQQNGGSVPQPYFSAASAAAPTPVYGGQQQETVTLKVVYTLGP